MTSNLGMKTRKFPRKAARIKGKIRYGLQETDIRIVNVSMDGIALELFSPIHAAAGSAVKIECGEIGYLEGVVCWARNGRVGVHFKPSSNARAQMASYFRFTHRE